MVLGAVRLRTWARPERASGEASPVQVCRGTASRGVAGFGKARRAMAGHGPVRRGREARMVVGQVRFLARARRESARGAASPGWHGQGSYGRGVAGLGGALDGRRWGSTPHRGAARKRSCRGTVAARRGMARQGRARHGRQLGRSEEGFDSPPERGPKGLLERREWAGLGRAWRGVARRGKARGALLADTGVQVPGAHDRESGSWSAWEPNGLAWFGATPQGKEHNGGPGVLSPRPPQARQLTHPGGYQ